MKSTVSKVYSLLTAARRRAAVVLLGFIIVGTLLEVLGIGLLLPVMLLLVEDNLEGRYPAVQPLLEILGNPDHHTQIQIVMIGLVAVYFTKKLLPGFPCLVAGPFFYWIANRICAASFYDLPASTLSFSPSAELRPADSQCYRGGRPVHK